MQKLKIFFSTLLLIWGIWHCTAISLLVIPQNSLSKYYNKVVSNYSLPLFPQVWLLFGPQFSGNQRSMEYRCLNSSSTSTSVWKEWHEITTPLARHYQTHRFSSSGYLYRYLDELLMQTNNANLLQLRSNKPLLNNKALNLLTKNLCLKESPNKNAHLLATQIRIIAKLPKKISWQNNHQIKEKQKFYATVLPITYIK